MFKNVKTNPRSRSTANHIQIESGSRANSNWFFLVPSWLLDSSIYKFLFYFLNNFANSEEKSQWKTKRQWSRYSSSGNSRSSSSSRLVVKVKEVDLYSASIFYLHITPYLPLQRSPDGASPDWGCGLLIAAYYSIIYPERMKCSVGLVGWPTADSLPT